MNADGSKVAVGAQAILVLATGCVHIFEYANQSWARTGNINGETSGDYSGFAVSLDSEGDLVAISADLNDGNGTNAGHVRIFNASGCFVTTNFTIKNTVPSGSNLESPATATICENSDFDAYGLVHLPGVTGGSTCDNFDKFCTGSAISFPAGVDQASAHTTAPSNNYGCLGTTPNPAWYYMEMQQPGNLTIDITNSVGQQQDLDFAIWGPFNDLNDAIFQLLKFGSTHMTVVIQQLHTLNKHL